MENTNFINLEINEEEVYFGNSILINENRILSHSILAKEVARKIKSFDHFIYLWGHKHGYYLPPKHSLTWSFIAQILTGKKKLLKIQTVGRSIDIPKMRGLRVNELYRSLYKVNNLGDYFPDFANTDTIPRNYFFDVKSKGF